MIYLASPYTHELREVEEQRYSLACRAAGYLIRQGLPIFSPICHSHPIALRTDLPTDHKFWMDLDYAFLRHCTDLYVLRLSGWDRSKGVAWEMTAAEGLGIPMRMILPEEVGLHKDA